MDRKPPWLSERLPVGRSGDRRPDRAPDTPFGAAMVAGVPFPFAFGLDAGAVDQKVQRTGSAAIGKARVQRFFRRHNVPNSDTDQSSPTSCSRPCTNPVVCRSGIRNSAFKGRQVWIAASLKCCRRPRIPLGGGTHSIRGSNQIESDPRRNLCNKAVARRACGILRKQVQRQIPISSRNRNRPLPGFLPVTRRLHRTAADSDPVNGRAMKQWRLAAERIIGFPARAQRRELRRQTREGAFRPDGNSFAGHRFRPRKLQA